MDSNYPVFGITQLQFEAATAIVDIREEVHIRALQFSEDFFLWYRKGEYSIADLPTSSVSLSFEWSVLRDKDVGKARELIRHYRSTCLIVGEIRDEALIELLDSIPVQLLYVRSGITDKAIHAISALRSLEWLILGRGCQISDRGFVSCVRCRCYRDWTCSGTSISSLEASHEHGFQRLTELILDGNKLNNEGFHQLSRLQRLTMLSVCRSNGLGLTAAGVADLKNLNQLNARPYGH